MGSRSDERIAMYTRPRHHAVDSALTALDGEFLARAQCFFGGGTRVVLELKEYRESADIDFPDRFADRRRINQIRNR